MATLAARGSGTPVTSGTTWTTVTNAVDGAVGSNPATYAVFTNATNGGTGYIEIGNYAFSSLPADATITSVTVSVRSTVSNTGRWTSIRFQPYDGATAIGTLFTGTLTTSASNDTTTFPVTVAQLKSATFKIRVTALHAANTQSGTMSIDYADVTVVYSAPAKNGTGTISNGWAPAAVGKRGPGRGTAPTSHSWVTAAVGVKPADPSGPPNTGSATVAWSMSFPAGGASDDFNRTDANNPGPDWTRCAPAEWSYVTITNNELNSLPSGWQTTYLWKTDPPDITNCFAEIDYWTGGGESRGPVICHSHDVNDAGACYNLAARVWWPQVTFMRNGAEIAHWNVTPPVNDPDRWVKLRLERVGAELRGYVDGALVGTWTDPSPLTGAGIGWGSLTEANEGPTRMDNWAGGGIGAGGGAIGKSTPKGTATTTWTMAASAVGSAPSTGPVGDRYLEDGSTDRLTEAGVERKLEPYVAPPNQGTVIGSWNAATAAVGKRAPKAAGTGQWTETLQVVGRKLQKGTATTAHAWAPAAVGKRSPTATATSTWTEAPAAVGYRAPKATATTQWVEALTAAGKRPAKGAATTVTWTEALAATGKRVPQSLLAVAWTEAVTAVGKKTTKSSLTTTHTWVTAAAGVRAPRGAALLTHLWTPTVEGNNDPWVPSLLPGLAIWLDASVLEVGEIEFMWPDLSGSNNNGYIVGSPNPIVRPGALSGKSVVRFKTSGSLLRMTETGMDLNWTLVYVGRMWALNAAGRIVTSQYPPSNLLIGYWNFFEDVAYVEGFLNPNMQKAMTTEWRLYTGTGEGVPGDATAWLYNDGVYLSGGAQQVSGGWKGFFCINGYDPYDQSKETADCEVAEVVMFDRRLSDVERNQVEDYLRLKWLMNPPTTGSATTAYDWATNALGRKAQAGVSTTQWTEVLASSASASRRAPLPSPRGSKPSLLQVSGHRRPPSPATTPRRWSSPASARRRAPSSPSTLGPPLPSAPSRWSP